jgi:hypothetical protein
MYEKDINFGFAFWYRLNDFERDEVMMSILDSKRETILPK